MGNKDAQPSATNVFILEEKVVRERERERDKLVETNVMDRGTSERATEASQGGNKERFDWPWKRRRRRRSGGELDSCCLGNSERKWASIKLCQGQFAVNGSLHLAALSAGGRWLLGGLSAGHAGRGPSNSEDRRQQ